MPFKIAQLPVVDKLCQQIEVASLEQVYPRQVVADLLTEHDGWEQRERKLTHLLMVYLVILLCLFPRHSLQALYAHLARAWRWVSTNDSEAPPTEGAELPVQTSYASRTGFRDEGWRLPAIKIPPPQP